MHSSALLTLAISALAAAAPHKRDSTYFEVGLSLRTSPGMTQPGVYEPTPAQMNQLVTLGDNGISVSEIRFDGTSSNVDINSVECRAYKDLAGVQPGSAPFTLAQPAEISTNLATISSILCYVTEN